jgi:hypothetical protein
MHDADPNILRRRAQTDGQSTGGRGGGEHPSLPCERAEHIRKTHHGRVRWYNAMLEDFEWREVPQTDERALEVLEGGSGLARTDG